ncbi:MAG: chromosomal replication initiator protein DnaA [Alphaproteobacteria bacterium]
MNDLEAQWQTVREGLRRQVGEDTFNSWIRPLSFEGVDQGSLEIGAPSRFMRDWVMSRYADQLLQLWQQENTGIYKVEFRVRVRADKLSRSTGNNTSQRSVAPETPPSVAQSAQIPAPAARANSGDNRHVGAPLDPRFTFDNFVVGKSNELAHAAARRVAEATEVQFNPLFLYGGVGLGKTHLMHAIAHEICSRSPARQVLYLSAEQFMNQFVSALRYKNTMDFKQQFRSVDVLMIDDVQFISGKNSTQEEFFHTFNALIDHNRQVIISADRSPSDLEGIEERIRSRLGWGLSADIHPTDYELRLGILQCKREQASQQHPDVEIPDRVLEFLAHRITSNIRELEGALTRVTAFASLVGRPITLEMVQDVLQDLLRANDRRITIEEIQRRTAEYFEIRLADMMSPRRARAVARPRQVAMYLAKQLTTRSLPEIGRKFGGRDHTTVMHAVKKIEELRETDAQMNDDVDLLKRTLEG